MTFKKCRSPRKDGATHLFLEGHQITLCDRLITDEYRIRPDEEQTTCWRCTAALSRIRKETA